MITKATIRNIFTGLSPDVKSYFLYTPDLIDGFPPEVCLAYLFSGIRAIHRRAFYLGIVRKFNTDREITFEMVDRHTFQLHEFTTEFERIFGLKFDAITAERLKHIQEIRNRATHGQTVKPQETLQAVLDILEYAEALNGDLKGMIGKTPFKGLEGAAGRIKPLNRETSQWILKGMGLAGN